ncbi:hypothetical protein [Streptomyces sp. NPDC018610]|uniref:hypothetical protein n=1 Tax=Streptomyces sp. NPDC018610 TaxID=3365049 RepID=UPI0037BBE585
MRVEAEQGPGPLREVALPRERLAEVALRTGRPRTVQEHAEEHAEEHRGRIAVRLGIVGDGARKALGFGGGVLVR